jgi:hypothetical protein
MKNVYLTDHNCTLNLFFARLLQNHTNMQRFLICAAIAAFALYFSNCSKSTETEGVTGSTSIAKVNFVFKFDSTQERLNNIGLPEGIPAGHSAQSPVFNLMSAHYVELASTGLTALGSGDVLYKAPEVTTGGAKAIDFAGAVNVKEGEVFLSVPVSSITPGDYQYLRVSLAYQNYDIKYNLLGQDFTGTVASFIGFNTYISSYTIKDSTVNVNGNKLQGYWAFETPYSVFSGDAAATTVPNPIASTSPIPPGSCVVTGAFSKPLTIKGNETKDIKIVVSLSTNKSFEWKDHNRNGLYEPLDADSVVNMGIRGLIPIVQ